MSYEILTSLLSNPTLETWVFYILSALAICLGIGVLHDRVIIRSGFILIGVFGAIAGIFLLLSAQFIAMAQIMIYAVAITLVVVIALMLTNPRQEIERIEEGVDESLPPVAKFFASCKRNASLWVAVLSFLTIYVAISAESRWPMSTLPMTDDSIRVLGEALTTTYAIPFEFSSVLLMAALMGAIMLAKPEPKVKAGNTVEGEALLQESPKEDDTLALTR